MPTALETHQHECPKCGTLWGHNPLRVSVEDSEKSHTCPKRNCGEIQTMVYDGTGNCKARYAHWGECKEGEVITNLVEAREEGDDGWFETLVESLPLELLPDSIQMKVIANKTGEKYLEHMNEGTRQIMELLKLEEDRSKAEDFAHRFLLLQEDIFHSSNLPDAMKKDRITTERGRKEAFIVMMREWDEFNQQVEEHRNKLNGISSGRGNGQTDTEAGATQSILAVNPRKAREIR